MSNSDNTKRTFPFTFRIEEPASESTSWDSRITLYNGRDDLEAQEYGTLDRQLPAGIYTVRVERGGEMTETVIRHSKPTKQVVKEPRRFSAMPSFDTTTSHEYYAYTSMDWSKKDTGSQPMTVGNASADSPRLFIFVRAPSEESYSQKDLGEDLFLLDLDGRILTDFNEQVTERDLQKGWLAFSAPAERGYYILRYTGEVPRELPIYVDQGWDTQVFLMYRNGLLFDLPSVLLAAKGQGFNPDDRMTQALDAALSGLQSGRDLLSKELQQYLLYGKFENPMLGLLGAHLLLNKADPNPDTVSIVLGNLGWLLEDSPDVQALRIRAALRFGTKVPTDPVSTPPMLRAGLQAVLKAGVENPAIIPEETLMDQVATYLYADSPWSSWKPLQPLFDITKNEALRKQAENTFREKIQLALAEEPKAKPSRIYTGEKREFPPPSVPEVERQAQTLKKRIKGAFQEKISTFFGEQPFDPIFKNEKYTVFNSKLNQALNQRLKGLNIPYSDQDFINKMEDAFREQVDAYMKKATAEKEATTGGEKQRFDADWVSTFLEDAMERSRRRGQTVDLRQLAADVGLPVRILERAYKTLKRSSG